MSNSSLPNFSLPMPISSLPSFLYPCPTPPCAVIYANASLLIAFSLSISSLSIPSLPSHPCPCPSPQCQSPHCPLILAYLSSFSWSVSMHISTLPYHLIHTHLLAHANLISPVPVLNDANLDCFIQPTECGRFSQVSLCKMKWKKSHTFYFFFQKNERSRMSKLCKNGKYLCEYEDGEVKTLYDAFKRGARVSSKNME